MLKYIILGIVQGLTEFLPVSSSAHLVIMQNILGVKGEELAVTVILHLGTALAVVLFFFRDILKAFRSLKTLLLITIVTALTGAIGLTGKDFFETLFSSAKAVSIPLAVTGIILVLTSKFKDAARNSLSIKDAVILGIAQAIAIIPGISRSGITVSTLLFRRIDRETCFRFSFLASIPAILGASLLEARKIDFAFKANAFNLIIGSIFSFFTGLVSLWVLKLVIRRAKLYYFGYYCIVASIVSLFLIK